MRPSSSNSNGGVSCSSRHLYHSSSGIKNGSSKSKLLSNHSKRKRKKSNFQKLFLLLSLCISISLLMKFFYTTPSNHEKNYTLHDRNENTSRSDYSSSPSLLKTKGNALIASEDSHHELNRSHKKGDSSCVSTSLLPTQNIFLLNDRVGSVTRICNGCSIYGKNELIVNGDDEQLLEQCLLPTEDQANVNSPMPIKVRPWLSKAFHKFSMVLYYSSHTKNEMNVVGFDSSSGMWKRMANNVSVTFEDSGSSGICKSLHSPSIYINESEERLYMYLHGHGCQQKPSTIKNFQPTLLYTSSDGLKWQRFSGTNTSNQTYIFWNKFYASTPVYNPQDGFYYTMARIADEHGTILCRSPSLAGPFEEGPVIGLGLRHFDTILIEGIIYVFYSMMGDRPERLLLASIDTTMTTNWTNWKLLPGPRILQPKYSYEHGNEAVASTKEGPASIRHEVRDPRFLLHSKETANSHDGFSGLLFYVVQGEKGIAMANITVDLKSYHNSVRYRNQKNIKPDVLRSSSLVQKVENGTIGKNMTTITRPLLITGVGRIGTTSVCTLFRKIGIKVSHDNDVDCGPYPGEDGAVSWYDGFRSRDGKRYKHVIHMVRDPLKTIYSRITKCKVIKQQMDFLLNAVHEYEKIDKNETCSSFSLKHWVLRNSFVSNHASWMVRTENFFTEALTVWEVCMAASFDQQRHCPDLFAIEPFLKLAPSSLNSLYAGSEKSKYQEHSNQTTVAVSAGLFSWESLARDVGGENLKYIKIAQKMAYQYGYLVSGTDADFFASFEYDCKFTENDKYWDCYITTEP